MHNIAILADRQEFGSGLGSMLATEGFAVQTFGDIVDLFHGIIQWKPDVILLDLAGWTIREQAMTIVLRERLDDFGTRFVLITGLAHLRSKVPDAVDAVITRPCDYEDLLTILLGNETRIRSARMA